MASRAQLARTSITLPQRELSTADRLAAALDRSRSWVFAEAIRRWGAKAPGPDPSPAVRPAEPTTPPGPDLPPAVDLKTALQLSDTARLQKSQELTARFRRAHPRAGRMQIIAFESQEDFLAWKEPG